jgi:predicted RNA binding protein YcfA (HicA-like mRNA interferase family)
MGGEYPALDRNQVEAILKALGFQVKRQRSSHAQWEGHTLGQRRIVTVDYLKSAKEKYGRTLLNKMVQ